MREGSLPMCLRRPHDRLTSAPGVGQQRLPRQRDGRRVRVGIGEPERVDHRELGIVLIDESDRGRGRLDCRQQFRQRRLTDVE